MKKLILVNPAFGGFINGSVGRAFKLGYPPIFSILESMTPHYNIKIYNQPFKIKYEKGLIGITCFTSNAYRAYKYADKFRKKGAKVIIGGPHVMFNTEEALQHCDSVIVGEVEKIWNNILKDYENNELKNVYHGETAENFWEYYHDNFLKLEDKKKQNTIQTTRGCKFQCKFCMIPKLYGNKIRHTPVDKVIEQVKSIKGFRKKAILFNDNNIIANPSYARRLFKALKPLNIRWQALCSIDIAKDRWLLDLAKESGCCLLNIGFETTNEKVINNHPGKLNLYKEYIKLIKRIKKRRIKIRGTFMIGFDEDTYKSLGRLFLFTLKANLFLSIFSVLTPFPGTKLFEEYKNKNKITTFNWKRYNAFNVVIRPKKISRFDLMLLTPLFRISFLLTTNMGRLIITIFIIVHFF